MSKVKFSFSALITLMLMSVFSVVVLAAAPANPTNVQHTVTGTSVTITWDAVTDADGYNVYWNGAKKAVKVTSPTFTIDENKNNSLFLYKVSALTGTEESTKTDGKVLVGNSVNKVLPKNNGQTGTHKTHGDFQNNTNVCQSCHNTHAGSDEKLMKYSGGEYETCMTCHDGTLGFYDVNANSTAGVFNSSHESASMHGVEGEVLIGSAPGNSGTKAGDHANKVAFVTTSKLECSSCHNPHGSPNDRLIKENFIGTGTYSARTAADAWAYTEKTVDSVVTKTKVAYGVKTIDLTLVEDARYNAINTADFKITVASGPQDLANNKNTDDVAIKSNEQYAKFCAGCHDNYTTARTTAYQDKDGVSLHTHNAASSSAGRNCWSCHFAHGSDVTLMKDSGGRTVADLQQLTTWTKPGTGGTGQPAAIKGGGMTESDAIAYMKDISEKGSQLKKFTNMSVCLSCHTSSHPINTKDADGANYNGKPTK